jgi:acetyltransferase-like isoleucine patch superfamily enzyme
MSSFYSLEELRNIGLKKFGRNVLISRYTRIYHPQNISIGNNVRIDDFCVISGSKYITMGDYIHIASHCGLWGNHGITMCDFSNVSSGTKIYSESDDFKGDYLMGPTVPQKYRNIIKNNEIILGKHVTIGANCVVLPGVVLEEGSVVGCGSLVNKNCESWTIYGGLPAKIIGSRNKNVLELEKQLNRE